MKIFKKTDKISVKVKDIEIKISPLSFAQKSEVQELMLKAANGDIKAGMEGTRLAMKYAIKDMTGVQDAEGNAYKLELENDELTNDCVEELFNCELSNELSLIVIQMLANIPNKFINPNTGELLQGVEIISPKKKAKTK